MSTFTSEPAIISHTVATSPDQATAEQAVQQLQKEGYPLDTLLIEGHNIEQTQRAVGLVSRGKYVRSAALIGACCGWLLGISLRTALLVVPKLGLVVAAGSFPVTLLAIIEGIIAGILLGSLVGALVGWIVPRQRAIKYDIEVKSGQFVIVVRSTAGVIARARILLASKGPELIEVYEPQRHEEGHSGIMLP
jgi:hypothetical protein